MSDAGYIFRTKHLSIFMNIPMKNSAANYDVFYRFFEKLIHISFPLFSSYEQECVQISQNACSINLVSKQEKVCKPVSSEQCVVNYERVCQTVYDKKCHMVEKKDYKQQCKHVQDQQCIEVLETV